MLRNRPVEPSGFGVRVPGGVRSPRSGPVYPDRALTSGTPYGRQTLWLVTVILIFGSLLACTTSTTSATAPQQSASSVRTVAAVAPADVVLTAPPQLIPTTSRHSAFPGLVQSADGSLKLEWRGGTDHADTRDGSIYSATSTNQGRTWSAATTVRSGGHDYRDPSVSYIGGHRYMTYFTGASDADPAQGAYVIRDDGTPVRIDNNMPYAAISAPVVQLPDGRLGVAFYGHLAGESLATAWMGWSSDLGATWTTNRVINSGIDTAEPVLVVDGSTVHMVARWGGAAIAMRSSTNSGASGSWGPVRVVVTDCTGRPSTTITQAGTLIMICRGPLSQGPHAKVVYSLDHGQTWRVGPTILTAPAGSSIGITYAAMAEVLPGVILAVFGMESADGSSQLYRCWLAEVTA